jgi:hypothetical protein
MKHQPILSPLLVLLMLASAQAQKGDWQVVKNLASDQLISVQVRHHWIRLKCRFEYATDDQLLCSYGWPLPISEVAYPRDKIFTVRVAHNPAAIGLAIGAGAGAVIGVSQNPINGLGRGGNALIDAGFFGLLGAGVGGLVSPLFPGKVIYRAAGVKPGEHGPKPPPPAPAKPPEKPESTPDATAPEKPQFATHTSSSGLSESCGPACVHTLHPDTVGEITAGPLRYSSCD